MNKHRKRKALALSLGLAAMTLTANSLCAQTGGGLFGKGFASDEANYGSRGMMNITESTEDGFTNADFGETAPLGSGLAILIGAGLGYVALKKKEDEQ